MRKAPKHAVFINEKFRSINAAKLCEINKMYYCFLTEQWGNMLVNMVMYMQQVSVINSICRGLTCVHSI